MLRELLLAVITVLVLLPSKANSAAPLVTDDAGTQGKGKFQLEINGEYGVDKEGRVTEKSFRVPIIPFLTYGLTETTDIVFGLPYNEVTSEDAGATTAVRGIGDASLELKIRFYEKDGLSFAVKPGITLPTGDENKELGNGRSSYHAFLIATKELQPWAFYLNLGYIRNEFKLKGEEDADRKDIWNVSLATQVEVANQLKSVVNIGMERNSDKISENHPGFILGGLIYSVSENLDVDAGIKYGLNKPALDVSYLAGVTWKL